MVKEEKLAAKVSAFSFLPMGMSGIQDDLGGDIGNLG